MIFTGILSVFQVPGSTVIADFLLYTFVNLSHTAPHPHIPSHSLIRIAINHCVFLSFARAGVKTTIIYPATDDHIVKHSAQEVFIFDETPADYAEKTLPYLEAGQFSLDVSDFFDCIRGRVYQQRTVCVSQITKQTKNGTTGLLDSGLIDFLVTNHT